MKKRRIVKQILGFYIVVTASLCKIKVLQYERFVLPSRCR